MLQNLKFTEGYLVKGNFLSQFCLHSLPIPLLGLSWCLLVTCFAFEKHAPNRVYMDRYTLYDVL